MENSNFAHLDTPVLKKRMRLYNLITIGTLALVIGGIGLYTVDEEKYKIVFYASIAVSIIVSASLRTWAIQMKKEVKRREG